MGWVSKSLRYVQAAASRPFYAMGWSALSFTDRLKLVAFVVQAGGGIAMTGFAAFGMWHLARLGNVGGLLAMGMTALILVGIVLTGFGALLYQRTVEFEVLGSKFKASDAVQTQAIVDAITKVQKPEETSND